MKETSVLSNLEDKFTKVAQQHLPPTFYNKCFFVLDSHGFLCHVWHVTDEVPDWEVCWSVEDINDMKEARGIAQQSVKAIRKKL